MMHNPVMSNRNHNLLLWNCNGLQSHIPMIQRILSPSPHSSNANSLSNSSSRTPSILLFTETHLSPNSKISNITDYQWFHSVSRALSLGRHRGGVSALIHHSIACRTINSNLTLSTYADPTTTLWLELHPPNCRPFIIGLVYLYTNIDQTSLSSLFKSMKDVCNNYPNHPIFLLGDFNLHHYDWNDNCTEPTTNATRFVDTINELDLDFCVNSIYLPNQPTSSRSSTSIIDLVFTNQPSLVDDLSFSHFRSSLHSDHFPLDLQIDLSPPVPLPSPSIPIDNPRLSWNLKKADWVDFEKRLTPLLRDRFPFDSLSLLLPSDSPHVTHSLNTITNANQILNECIHDAAVAAVGLKRISKQSKHWFSYSKVQPAHQQLIDAYHAYNSAPSTDSQAHSTFSAARREWKEVVKEAKNWSWSNLCEEIQSDPRSQLKWSIFKRSMPSSYSPISSIPDRNNNLPNSLEESLNNFATAFVDSAVPPQAPPRFNRIVSSALRSPPPVSPANSFLSDRSPFTIEVVAEQLKWQHTDTACGPDSIAALFLKHGGDFLAECLSALYNFSWFHSVLPQSWRDADVIPLYKGKGARHSPLSFRPISMTSIIIRTFEHLIHHQLVREFDTDAHTIFDSNQFGFRNQRSTEDALFYLHFHLQKLLLSQHGKVPVAFLDLKKAFDRVDPDTLLYRLRQEGIGGYGYKWVESFLTDRRFRVVSTNSSSNWFKNKFGVPQGCVLSPFLFLTYINPVAQKIRLLQTKYNLDRPPVHIILFADDIAIFPDITIDNWKLYFQEALDCLSEWSADFRMEWSPDKSQIVFFGRSKNQPANPVFFLSNFQLQEIDRYRYLGIIHDRQLNWSHHSREVIAKARSDSYLISRIISRDHSAPFFPAIRALVMGYLRPRCLYGIAHWKPSETTLHKLQSSFLYPLKRILRLPYSASNLGTLVEANCPSFETFRQQQILRFGWRATQCLTSSHPTSVLFSLSSTEFQTDFTIPKYLQPLLHECEGIENSWNIPTNNPLLKISFPSKSKSKMLEQTYHDWSQSGSTAPLLSQQLKPIDKPSRSIYLYREKDKRISNIRSQFRAGRFRTNQWLHRMNRSIHRSPNCPLHRPDSIQYVETVQHILLECDAYRISRNLLRSQLRQLQCDLNLSSILGVVNPTKSRGKLNWENADSILHYTGLFLLKLISNPGRNFDFR